MMDFFSKIFMSEEVLILFFEKKNQIWSKNPKISFRQFKMTLAEGGYRFKKKQNKQNKTKCLLSNKNINVALF